jgi:hypothetical protein
MIDLAQEVLNPMHGSAWICSSPTYQAAKFEEYAKSHARQCVDRSSPTYRPPLFESDAARGERSRILDNSLELRAERRDF